MNIKLLYNTPLWVCAMAIRQCWDSRDKSDTHLVASGCIGCNALRNDGICDEGVEDTCRNYENGRHLISVCGEKDRELIHRIGNQNKHKSVLEHLVYTFDIDGISRAVLQELARHRIASYSVKSTRYTLKELKDEDSFEEDTPKSKYRAMKYLVDTNNIHINTSNRYSLENLRLVLVNGASNDIAKYCLPEAYKTSLTMTINARALQNFLELRTSKHALWEIQLLARAMFEALPDDHKYLFEDYLYGSMDGSI